MSVSQQRSDGTWEPAKPLPIDTSFIDVEAYSDGTWVAYRGVRQIARGTGTGWRFRLAVLLLAIKHRRGVRVL